MNYLYVFLLSAGIALAGTPVQAVDGQPHDVTIQNAIRQYWEPGYPKPVSAGYNGEGNRFSGWTQSKIPTPGMRSDLTGEVIPPGIVSQTKPGLLEKDWGAGAEVAHSKAAAAIAHPQGQTGGHAWAQAPVTKVSAKIQPGGLARLTVTQPGQRPQTEEIHGRGNQMRYSQKRQGNVVDNKQTRTFVSNIPGQQVHVKADFPHGTGQIKVKGQQAPAGQVATSNRQRIRGMIR